MDPRRLAEWTRDARERIFEAVADLDDGQMLGPHLPITNPLLWEIGHMAWFQEKWVLRHAGGRPPLRADADSIYDSMAIPHDVRWDLPLPSREETYAYMREVRDCVLHRLDGADPSPAERYHVLYSLHHEDMHTEAFTYMRQTLAYPAPRLSGIREGGLGGGPHPGDARIPGGTFLLGSSPEEPFVFDNEKWAHPVQVAPFSIAKVPVTQAEFARFAGDGGYRRRELWSEAGWAWREKQGAFHPVHWRRVAGGGWQRRDFDRWVPLEPHRPAIHLNWHEAEAYCCWAKRRLPTEAEWELAATGEPLPGGGFSPRKRRYPWGDEPPTPERARLDWQGMGCAEVGAHAAGDSAFGCRQMIGNVWEWTASGFIPFPGFTPDPYEEYSEPWFRTRKVLRGGCWATRSRLIRANYRNFFTPDRRDVFAGFRTCAL